MEVLSKQGLRLKEFIDYLELSLDGFRKQCNIGSTNTIPDIVNKGKTPSYKVLNKIISRYPQLNKDWIELGIGDMILVQFSKNNEVSNSAFSASQNSQYTRINDSLINHDFALNEVILKLQTAIHTQNEHTLLLSNKIEKLQTESTERTKLVNKASETFVLMSQTLVEKFDLSFEKFNSSIINKYNKHVDWINQNDLNREEFIKENVVNGLQKVHNELKAIDQLVKEAVKDVVLNSDKNNRKTMDELGTFTKTSKTRL